MPFEKLDPNEMVRTGDSMPALTIRRDGSIVANAGGMAVMGLGDYVDQRVDLLYDPDLCLLAVQPNNENGAVPVDMNPLSASFRGNRLIAKFGLGDRRGYKYPAVWDRNEKMLVAKLDGPRTEIKAGRRPVHPRQEIPERVIDGLTEANFHDDTPVPKSDGILGIDPEDTSDDPDLRAFQEAAAPFDYTADIPEGDDDEPVAEPSGEDTPF